MSGARRAQQSAVRLQVEVEFDRVHDIAVDHRAGWAVPALVSRPVSREEADVVALPDDNDGNRETDSKALARLCQNRALSVLVP